MQMRGVLTASRSMQKERSIQAVATVYKYGLQERTLIGKFFIGTVPPNMILAGDGRLIIVAEKKVFVAKIAASREISNTAFP
jgi:hypothetical protein